MASMERHLPRGGHAETVAPEAHGYNFQVARVSIELSDQPFSLLSEL